MASGPAFGQDSGNPNPLLVGPTYWHKGPLVLKTLTENMHPVGYVLVVPRGIVAHAALAPKVEPLSQLAQQEHALVAINGGFFNRSDGEPAAYVVKNGKPLADPHRNKVLMANPQLKPYLARIFDRPEWRIWKTPLGLRMAIEPHHEGPAPGWSLVTALQAGPDLLPEPRVAEEAFVRKDGDAIGSTDPRGRSALGIRSDGSLVLACVPMPPSAGLTIDQLRDLMLQLGAERAMALDGGAAAGLVAK
ncbi:MAG: phosphodiester glycosidase family protein, partial [Cyanobacteria bacterium REEB65]|nr:phosphodiester glycosidase family protein [Cyanobacteria bacterium REEB65]